MSQVKSEHGTNIRILWNNATWRTYRTSNSLNI